MMLYRENNLNETAIGKIPRDWEVAKLGDVISLEYGKGLPENTRAEGGFPVVGSNGVVGYHNQALVKGPGIVVGRKGTIGAVSWVDSDFWPIDTTYYVTTKRKDVSLKWLFLELQHMDLGRLDLADVVPGLKRDMAYNMKIPLPPAYEQQEIAEALSIGHTTLDKISAVIEKTELLKKGLMQELLFKGIGHREFIKTDIGRIPKTWEVCRLADLILDVKNGFASGKRDDQGIVQIRMNNITTDGRLLLDSYLKVPIPKNIEPLLLKPDDLLFNNTNSIDLVGKSAIFKGAPFPCTFSNHFTRIRFRESSVLPEWILYRFITLWEEDYFRSVAIRHVGQAAVHTEYLLRLRIPLPPLPEQQKIIDVLSTTDRKLALERDDKIKTDSICRTLTSLLLTGKIRVKED